MNSLHEAVLFQLTAPQHDMINSNIDILMIV